MENKNAGIIYPGMAQAAAAEDEGEKTHSSEELANILYPEKSEQYAETDDVGGVKDVIRDTAGLIKYQGIFHGDIEMLAARNNDDLENAVLQNKDFSNHDMPESELKGADLSGSKFGSLRGSNLEGADLRGCKLTDLRCCNLKNVIIDETTDLEGCNFIGASGYDISEIKRCKGWDTARGLHA